MSYFLSVPRALIEDLILLISDILSGTHDLSGKRFICDFEIWELEKMKENLENLVYDHQTEFVRWLSRRSSLNSGPQGTP